MLTTDLVRAQVRAGVLHPRWIEPDKASLLEDAAELVARFSAHLGKSAGELDEAVQDFAALRTDVILVKGLAKLLWDRATVGTIELKDAQGQVITPSALREHVFRAAGARWPVRPGGGPVHAAREAILAEAATSLGLTPEQIELSLYADRGDEQRVLALEPITPGALLQGYNLALAQACLLKARELRVEVGPLEPKRARALFRELKFRRLLFRAETLDEGRYRLVLDGPLSLFKQTSRYGLSLALFLPALVRCERWSLEADLTWTKGQAREVVLRLDQGSPLTATGRDTGTWTSAEEDHFIKAFAALDTPWSLSPAARVIDLDGRDVLVPDYALTHPDGREALLELVFAWRRDTFMKRVALLAAAGPGNLVIALHDKGGLDDHTLPDTLTAYRFKGVINPKKVIELAERIALAQRRSSEPP